MSMAPFPPDSKKPLPVSFGMKATLMFFLTGTGAATTTMPIASTAARAHRKATSFFFICVPPYYLFPPCGNRKRVETQQAAWAPAFFSAERLSLRWDEVAATSLRTTVTMRMKPTMTWDTSLDTPTAMRPCFM